MNMKIKIAQFAVIFLMTMTIISGIQAATFTVNDTEDVPDTLLGDGICSGDFLNQCTLRAAIMEINFLNQSSNTIILPSGIYTLTRPNSLGVTDEAQGDLNLNKPVTIIGANARTTFIQAGTTRSTNGTNGDGIDRVINNASNSTINNVTIRYGKTNFNGGGIFSNNFLTINNSTISDNWADGSGGIHSANNLVVTNSLISANISNRIAGGIFTAGGAISSITNTTISGNFTNSTNDAGGLTHGNSSLTVTNCTIVNNVGANNGVGGFYSTTSAKIRNTIVANNFAGATPSNVDSTFNSGGTNIIGPNYRIFFGFTASDILNTSSVNLGPLQNNGGPTDTKELLAGSSAIAAGQSCVRTATCSLFNAPINITTDQRLMTRVGYPMTIGAYSDFNPTAATATINGRITTSNGNGIRNVRVSLTNQNGETSFAVTTPFGYYNFQDLPVGETYILSVNSKRFTFAEPTRAVNLSEDLTNEDFVAQSELRK